MLAQLTTCEALVSSNKSTKKAGYFQKCPLWSFPNIFCGILLIPDSPVPRRVLDNENAYQPGIWKHRKTIIGFTDKKAITGKVKCKGVRYFGRPLLFTCPGRVGLEQYLNNEKEIPAMPFNLLDSVKDYFNPEVIRKAARYLGETEPGVKIGLNAIFPVVITGIVQKAEAEPERLLNLADTAYATGISSNPGAAFTPGGEGVPTIAPNLMSELFGGREASMANAISEHTGLKGASTASLFATVTTLATALTGKYAIERHLSPQNLSALLVEQKGRLWTAFPDALKLAGMQPGYTTVTVTESGQRPHEPGAEPGNMRWNWTFPLVSGLVACLITLVIAVSWKGRPDEGGPKGTDDVRVPIGPINETELIRMEPPGRENHPDSTQRSPSADGR